MRRPFKNREAFRKIKKSLISNYLEYISQNKTKENPQRLAYLITLISSIESKLITHLKSRRMKHIPLNYNKIRFITKYKSFCHDTKISYSHKV